MVAFDEMYTLFNAFDGVIKFLHGVYKLWCLFCLRSMLVVVVYTDII